MSLNPKMQNAEEAEEPVIKITKDGVSVPDGIYFSHEEIEILGVLHRRLGFGMLTLQEAAVRPRST